MKARVYQHFEVFQHEFANFSLPCEGRLRTEPTIKIYYFLLSDKRIFALIARRHFMHICVSPKRQLRRLSFRG